MIKLINLDGVENVSAGRDTNSSSSHSLVLDENDLNDLSFMNEYSGSYGNRQRFNCVTKEAKADYIATYLKDDNKEFLSKLDFNVNIDEEGYVDDGSWLNNMLEFVDDELNFMLTLVYNNSVVIIGGADESDEYCELEEEIAVDNWNTTVKDQGGYYLILDISSGDKYRIKKYGQLDSPIIAEVPELVDMKITNKCNVGCEFCYQNSHPKGKNCSVETFKLFIDRLPKYTSLAIGGGEVWEHPNWYEMLDYAINKDMLVNFTTNSIEEIKTLEVEKPVGVGVSITDINDIYKIDELRKLEYNKLKYNLHIIPELVDMEFMEKLVSILHQDCWNEFNILLLGYKDIGRGKKRNLKSEYEMKTMFKYLYKNRKSCRDDLIYNLNVDTKLANDYEGIMTELFSKKTWYKEEGKYSAFYDVIEDKLCQSSYQKENGVNVGEKSIKVVFDELKKGI